MDDTIGGNQPNKCNDHMRAPTKTDRSEDRREAISVLFEEAISFLDTLGEIQAGAASGASTACVGVCP